MDKAPLDKAINYFTDQIKLLHAGGSASVILEEVKVDAYNSKMKIRDLGTINSLGGGTYVINLWDNTIIDSVKIAIMNGLNLNANVDGATLKVTFPSMTQEKRQELSKIVARNAEDCLISIRNIRRDFISEVDKDFKEKNITEDEKRSQTTKIDALIKDYSKKVDEIKENKITEINTL